jgi:hypothetical protein
VEPLESGDPAADGVAGGMLQQVAGVRREDLQVVLAEVDVLGTC